MDKANSQVMNEENQTPTLCSIPPESKASRGVVSTRLSSVEVDLYCI